MSKRIMRHLMEVRFERHLFNFMDYKGELIDFLSGRGNFEKIKVNSNRIDIGNEDLSFFIFLSTANLGMQIETSLDFNEFKNKISKNIKLIKIFEKYKLGKIKRIGTKTTILEKPPASNFVNTNSKFNALLEKNIKFENKIGMKIGENILNLKNCKEEGGKFHIFSQVMQKDDAIKKYFDNDTKYVAVYKDDFGICTDIDYFNIEEEGERTISKINWDELDVICTNNIERLEFIYSKFLEVYVS